MEFSKPIQTIEFKADNNEWSVDGYPSTFGNLDLGEDIVVKGAFTETLKSGPKVRFLLSHDPRLILGTPKKLKEDEKGLFGSFKISKTQLGTDTHQLLLDGAIDSFSIGYEAKDWEIIDGGVRLLKKVDLYEVSLVPMAMNQDAIVTDVKEYMTLAEKTANLSQEMQGLLNDLRGLVDGIDRPLSETKRHELTELLATFAGLDAVRSDLQSVLATAPAQRVSERYIRYQLSEARKRLAGKNII